MTGSVATLVNAFFADAAAQGGADIATIQGNFEQGNPGALEFLQTAVSNTQAAYDEAKGAPGATINDAIGAAEIYAQTAYQSATTAGDTAGVGDYYLIYSLLYSTALDFLYPGAPGPLEDAKRAVLGGTEAAAAGGQTPEEAAASAAAGQGGLYQVPPGTAAPGAGQPGAQPSGLDALIQTLSDYFKAIEDDGAKIVAFFSDFQTNAEALAGKLGGGLWHFITGTVWPPISQVFDRTKANLLYYLFGVGATPPNGGIDWSEFGYSIPASRGDIDGFIETSKSALQHPTGLIEVAWSYAVRAALAFSSITALLVPFIEEITQEANAANPVELLDPAVLIDARYKNLIDGNRAVQEAARHGIPAEDFTVMFESAAYVPALQEAARWLAMGIIDQSTFNGYAIANRAVAGSAPLYAAAAVRPASGASLINIKGRQAAAASGFMAGSLNSFPPADAASLYGKNQINGAQAEYDWISHWSLPGPEWFAQAYFRGLRSQADVTNAAVAQNYPAEIIPTLVEVSRPLLPLRVVTTLFSRKLISQPEAEAHYAKLGFTPADIALIVKYADSLNAKQPVDNTHSLSHLALNVAIGLYDDGAMSKAQLASVLTAHGYSSDAAALQIEYIDLKNAAKARKDKAIGLVDEVDLGMLTIQQAVSQLHADGYTPVEVLRYQKTMKRASASKPKLPTFAQAEKMMKDGIIDAATFRQYLVDENYSPAWVDNLVTLAGEQPKAKGVAGP